MLSPHCLAGEAVDANLWDMARFFDHVDLGLLSEDVITLGFPGAIFNLAVYMRSAIKRLTVAT